MENKKEGFDNEIAIVIPFEIQQLTATNHLTRNLYITDIGFYPHAKGHFRERSNGCTQHILIYCSDGEGWFDLGDGVIIIRKNDFFIIEAGRYHQYGASKQYPWSIYWFHFSGKQSNLFSSIFNCSKHMDNSPSSRFDVRIEMFQEIIANLKMGYSIDNMEYITLCLCHLMGSFRYLQQFREINRPKPIDVVQKVINYMTSHLDKQVTLEELADSVNYSPTYLSSLFTQKAGMSPINYFNHLKIQKACRLLDFTDNKIKEIAYELGFSDPYYFSKVFSKYMNMSPYSYRKQEKG